MEIINSEVQRYAEAHSTSENVLLARINRDTHANILRPRMLSGHLQGRILSMISHMVKPRTILEIGSYTGYSALCLAEGLAPEGRLITIDINEELEERVRKYIDEAGLASRIDYRIGNALSIIPTLEELFDLVFIDADKANNASYYDLVIENVRPGGFILVDNVLRSGKVVEDKMDKDGMVIDAFNKKVKADPRVEVVLLPVRDGILLIRKLSLPNLFSI